MTTRLSLAVSVALGIAVLPFPAVAETIASSRRI